MVTSYSHVTVHTCKILGWGGGALGGDPGASPLPGHTPVRNSTILQVIHIMVPFSPYRNAGRKVNFAQFMEIIQLMSEKKHHGEKNPEQILQAKIMEGKGPSVSGTTVSTLV